jgi:aarF domain-containing kinase
MFAETQLTYRNLDNALATTHSSIRIFLIVARYCSLAVYRDQLSTLTQSLGHANTFSLISQFTKEWWRFRVIWDGLRVMEWVLDAKAGVRKAEAWLMGLWRMGFVGARRAAAGLE